jgi:hypothetical protein
MAVIVKANRDGEQRVVQTAEMAGASSQPLNLGM